MEILVFGGTVFLSRAVAELGVARGHNVITFNRGLAGPPVAGARSITGDRTNADDLAALAGTSYDLVFDTGYLPEVVKASAELLAPSAGHYAFTSSINAYSAWPQAGYRQHGSYDGDPDAVGEQVPDDLPEGGEYGWRKVGAERAVLRAFGEHRCTLLRAGLIVGPNDRAGRLPWWLHRVARGGRTLAPGAPEDELRLIDARDIAEFALLQAPGTFEVTGPAHQINRGQLLAEAREITGSDAEFVWVSEDYLVQAGVKEWTELPLWALTDEAPGLWDHDTTAAEAAGLACRPVRDTLFDTWDWMCALEGGWQPAERTPGLAPERERELLAGWRG